jgi:starch synthase
MQGDATRVLMVTSELVPFAKAGGLGDMVPALSAELARQGVDVRIVMPRYYGIGRDQLEAAAAPLGVPMGGVEAWVGVFEGRLPGSEVPVYFLDHEQLFGREGIYGPRGGSAFDDNLARFALLSRGALQLVKQQEWAPDVVHAHDWPAAALPAMLYTLESKGLLGDTASVLTIHNLGYQGWFPKDGFPVLGLPWELYHKGGFERHGSINLLQAGIRFADILTTVSPTYAQEIQTLVYGEGLDALLRHRDWDLFGVLNGIDYEVWNPETDPLIPANFSHDDLAGKAVCKAALQREAGLDEDPDVPIVGIVSRLVDQKGFPELVGPSFGSLYAICTELDLQLVVLGTGDGWAERELMQLSWRLDNLSVALEFNERVAHLIEAGSDFFLMPSRYEPCGLNQMYSLRYGTLPIVRRTGGLADTVESYDERTGDGTGFVFDELTPASIYNTVSWATRAWYQRREQVEAMRVRAMQQRFSWAGAAERYAELYQWAIDRKSGVTHRIW